MTRRKPHWCDVCLGHTGRDSPCYDGPEDEDDFDPDAARDRQQDDDTAARQRAESRAVVLQRRDPHYCAEQKRGGA